MKSRRSLSEKELNAVSNGKIFIGSQALDLKLIDKIGDVDDAANWLKGKEELKNLAVQKVDLIKPSSKIEKLLAYSSDLKTILSGMFNKILL